MLTKLAQTTLKSKNVIINYRATNTTGRSGSKSPTTNNKSSNKNRRNSTHLPRTNKLSSLLNSSTHSNELSPEEKSAKTYFQSFSDSVNKVSSFLQNAKDQISSSQNSIQSSFQNSSSSLSSAPSKTRNHFANQILSKIIQTPDGIIGNVEWGKYLSSPYSMYHGSHQATSEAQSSSQAAAAENSRRALQQNSNTNFNIEEEKSQLEKINDERFYQRVALSKHTQKLLTDMSETLCVVKKIESPNLLDELTTNQPNPELPEKVITLISQLEQLAKLMTNQPESVLMAIRFDCERIIEDANLELTRLVRVPSPLQSYNKTPSPLSTTVNNPSVSSKRAVKICQVLTGQIEPPKGRNGVRILCLDGGGTRGILTLEVLRNIQKRAGGRPIHTLFDYIGGVSTGAILAFMIGVQKRPLDEIEEIYRELSSQVFSTTYWKGGLGLIQQYSYHNTDLYENMLQELFLDCMLLEAAIDSDCPKIAALSCLSNRPQPKLFLWRNYNLVYGKNMEQQIHAGTINAPVWKAVRASSAAPGYFREFQTQMNDKVRISPTSVDIHSDGGVLCNNPSFVARTECKAIWPDYELQTLVSIGTGRFEPTIGPSGESLTTSLLDKVNLIVNSATGVDQVHKTMYSTLPEKTYYRFNPYISENFGLDVYEENDLNALKQDAVNYCEKNQKKFDLCVGKLESKSAIRQKISRNYLKKFKVGLKRFT